MQLGDVGRYAPAGMRYQWVRKSLMGEIDRANLQDAADAGWVAVPWPRHADLFPRHRGEDGSIEFSGLVLMERSVEADNADREDERAAAVILHGMGCHKQSTEHHDPKVERARNDLRDTKWRRTHRALIRATAEALCTNVISPTSIIMVETPRTVTCEDASVPMTVVQETQSVQAWRAFEPKAIQIVRKALADGHGKDEIIATVAARKRGQRS
jgi:hypothetical protein